MLGADRAEDMLRGTGHSSVESYSELPNCSAFFTDALGKELGFFKDSCGMKPTEHIVSTRKGAWTMNPT